MRPLLILAVLCSSARAALPVGQAALVQQALREANARTPAALSKQLQAMAESPPQEDDQSLPLKGERVPLDPKVEASIRPVLPAGQDLWPLGAVTAYSVAGRSYWIADFGSGDECQKASHLLRLDGGRPVWLLAARGDGLRLLSLGARPPALVEADNFGCANGGSHVYAALDAKGGLGPKLTLNWWQKSFFYFKDLDGDHRPELVFHSRGFLPPDILKKLGLEGMMAGSPVLFHVTQGFKWDGKKMAPMGAYYQLDTF